MFNIYSVFTDRHFVWHNLCAASVITKNVLMTAAHCLRPNEIQSDPAKNQIYLGLSDLNGEMGGQHSQLLDIKRVQQHPNYDNVASYFDIGLIHTETEIKFTKLTKPLCLPKAPHTKIDAKAGRSADLAGWGWTEPDSTSKELKLRHETITVFSREKCNGKYNVTGGDDGPKREKFLPDLFNNTVLCAGLTVC